MGVPKFFRFVNERYPSLVQTVNAQSLPQFDYLYLDMNGIIHQSTHPDDKEVNTKLSLNEMFDTISTYIEHIFNLVKPTKEFFMAIDGVAPKAKMNQQRSRRFRAAQERIENMKQATKRGEAVDVNPFDSNCITPGTEFMELLHNYIQDFICYKKSTDPVWTAVRVLYSGHNAPGEGEHKIQDYIRAMRTLPDYDPNSKHCFYGLDADLIMLGLSTHEAHLSLLREEVNRGKTSKFNKDQPNLIRFEMLNISVMRLYIAQEFDEISHLPDYNLEHLIDDWIFMTYFLGCDFIPHMPNIDILEGGLTDMWRAYINVKPNMNGYLLDNGFINSRNVLMFIQEMAKGERGQETSKCAYYKSKFNMEMNEKNLKDIAFEFFQALHWVTHYYFFGVVSWDWFYPALYSPYISDLLCLNPEEVDAAFNFNLDSKPVLPFEQLLSVLPPQSSALLPEGFQYIMFDSDCAQFYPPSFKTDPNGKKRPWEHIVLIPFVDSEMIRSEMGCAYDNLTEEEKQRNSHGNVMSYEPGNGELDVQYYNWDEIRVNEEEVYLYLLEGSRPPVFQLQPIRDECNKSVAGSRGNYRNNRGGRSRNTGRRLIDGDDEDDEDYYGQYGSGNKFNFDFGRLNIN